MNFGDIIQQSWKLTTKHRFLWWLGILTAIMSSGSSVSSFANSAAKTGSSSNAQGTFDQAFTWISQHAGIITVAAIVLLLVYCVFVYISYAANAGLILSSDKLNTSNEELGFPQAFRLGRRYVGRLFGLSFIVFLIVIALLILAALFSAMILVILPHAAVPVLIVFALVFVPCFIAFAIYMSVLVQLANRAIVLNGTFVFDSWKKANQLIRHQLGNVFIAWLINVGLGIAVGTVTMIALFFLALLGILLGFGVYFVGHIIGTAIFAVLAGLLLLCLSLAISGFSAAFFSTYWTLSFRQLEQSKK